MAEFSASQIASSPNVFSAGQIAKPPESPGVLGSLWEGIGGKALMDIMGAASRDPARIQKAKDAISGIVHGLTNEGPRVMQEADAMGESLRHGEIDDAMHHAVGSVPLLGGAVQRIVPEWNSGHRSEAVGHTLALLAPAAVEAAPAALRAAADSDVGAAVVGGAKGAAKSLVETTRPSFRGVESPIPIPTTLASGAAGGQAAAMMGLPRSVGTVAGVAAPVIRGAIQGGREALAARAAAAEEAAIAARPRVAPIWQNDTPSPQPVQMTPQVDPASLPPRQFVRPPAPEPAPGTPAAQTIAKIQDIATRRPPPPPPAPVATMEDLATPPPQAAPTAPPPQTASLADLMNGIPKATRGTMADANYRAVKEGNAAPETAGPTYAAAARANKVENLAKKLEEAVTPETPNGITYAHLQAIPEAQRVNYISSLAKEAGERDFSAASVDALMTEMKRRASMPKASAPEQPSAPYRDSQGPYVSRGLLERREAEVREGRLAGATPAKSVKDMTRAELAKQAGLPENATTGQIMKALAAAMGQ